MMNNIIVNTVINVSKCNRHADNTNGPNDLERNQ